MKKILITGATSFIGVELIKQAVARGWQTIAVVRENSEKASLLKNISNCTVCEININEYGRLGNIAGKADVFVHLAWNGTRGADRLDEAKQKSNYKYSMDAIKSALDAGIKKIILAGSQAEYGNCSGIISEATECNPNTAYGVYKLKLFNDASALCKTYGAHLKEPRFFSLYGIGDYENTLVISMLKKMLANEACDLTQCIQMWDFLYLPDAVGAVLDLCDKDCADGAYNFGSGDTRQLKEYVEEMKRITSSNSVLNYGAVPYPATGMVSIMPDISKLKKEIGWGASTSFEWGIRDILDSFGVIN